MDTIFTGVSGIVLAVLLAIIVLLVLVIWSIRRHRNPILEFECGQPIETMLPSIAGLSLGAVVEGNHVEIFENGRFFDVLIDEIDGARHSVHFETFLWKDGVLGAASGRCVLPPRTRGRAGARDARRQRLARHRQGGGAEAERCRLQTEVLSPHADPSHRCVQQPHAPQDLHRRRARRVRRRSLHRRFLARRRAGQGTLRRREPARAGTHRQPPAIGVQRELGRPHRRDVRRRRRVPRAQARGHRADARGLRQARWLGAGGEDPAPRVDLLRQQAAVDPEPLLHPGARGDRSVRSGGETRRRRAGDDALHRRLGQPDGAARRALRVRQAAARPACGCSSTRTRCCTRR